jgi:hypothetical protein
VSTEGGTLCSKLDDQLSFRNVFGSLRNQECVAANPSGVQAPVLVIRAAIAT